METHKFKRNYRTHRSFLPMVVGYVEKKPETLEKLVSYMALKHVIQNIKPEAIGDLENEVYLQKISGVEDVEGLYTYFMKKGLSQSEVTHRLKRVKFLKLVNDSLYIIPPIELITDRIEEIKEPTMLITTLKIDEIAQWKVPSGHIGQAFTEFTKIAKHSGFISLESERGQRVFSGMGYKLSLGYSMEGKVQLKIEKDNSGMYEPVQFEKNSKNNYDHITIHTFSEFGFILKQAGFAKTDNSKLEKVFLREDCKLVLKWEEAGFSRLEVTPVAEIIVRDQ